MRFVDTFPGILTIGKSTTMTFIGFNFNGYRFLNEGSCTFLNCTFSNIVGGCFFRNEGSASFANCSFSNIQQGESKPPRKSCRCFRVHFSIFNSVKKVSFSMLEF